MPIRIDSRMIWIVFTTYDVSKTFIGPDISSLQYKVTFPASQLYSNTGEEYV
jgi:hypothetical protein